MYAWSLSTLCRHLASGSHAIWTSGAPQKAPGIPEMGADFDD